MKVVINTCFGGFGLSDAAYERMGELGVPIRKYQKEQPANKKEDPNEGEVIFDRELTPQGEDEVNDIYHKYKGKSRMSQRYWDAWIRSDNRSHPLVIQVVEELGSEKASGEYAKLKVVEVPDGVEYSIEEYEGIEHVAEKHRTWG